MTGGYADAGKRAGILLHFTSLPGEEGIGTIGREARDFVYPLALSGCSIWQVLPVHPTGYGDSPFQGVSGFAGNPNLVSLCDLAEAGDLDSGHYDEFAGAWASHRDRCGGSDGKVDFGFLWERKLGFDSRKEGYQNAALRRAFEGFRKTGNAARKDGYEEFCRTEGAAWLDDYARFMALDEVSGFAPWSSWEPKYRFRHQGYESGIDPDKFDFYRYVQFAFDEQMKRLHETAGEAGIRLMGNVPIYPDYNSADVWANRDLFQLNRNGRMKWMAAIPPDYFSKTGQLWRNPLWKWGLVGTREQHEKVYEMWAKRLKHEGRYFDMVLIDHMRGLVNDGRVRPGSKNARKARWIRGPGKEFVQYIRQKLPSDFEIVGEDLGMISPRVWRKLNEFGIPGIAVMQFIFFDRDPTTSKDHYLPRNAPHRSVYYTGTHDNESPEKKIGTLNARERKNFDQLLSGSGRRGLNNKIVDTALGAKSRDVMIRMQDANALTVDGADAPPWGEDQRMNDPEQISGQWTWRMTADELADFAGRKGNMLRRMIEARGRLPSGYEE